MKNIKILRKQNNMTQADLANHLNVHQTAVSQWESDRTIPDITQMKAMAKLFNVSMECIADVEPANMLQKFSKKGIKIPVYGTVPAGIPLSAIEDIIDYEEITPELAAKGEYISLEIKGDSMLPDLRNKDRIIIRLQDDVDSGDIAIIIVNGDEATCKKIKKDPKGVWLMPLNPAYEPMFYSNRQIEELPVRALGKVVELRRCL